MPTKLYYAIGVLVAAHISDRITTHKLRTTNHHIRELNTQLVDVAVDSEQRVLYLAMLLDEHEIELSEFDKIALFAAM
jgi:hypothetical protein